MEQAIHTVLVFGTVIWRIPLGSGARLRIYDSDTAGQVDVAVHSYGRPDAWASDWQALVERLTARFGADQVKVRQSPT